MCIRDSGETTGDAHFSFVQADGKKPFDLDVAQMFGHSPVTVMVDETVERKYEDVTYTLSDIDAYTERMLQLEAVACKDWLTNKVDPVSYTHLDVYKRQGVSCPEW